MKHGVSPCFVPSLFHLSPLPHINLYMYYNLKIELPFKPRSKMFMLKSNNGRLNYFNYCSFVLHNGSLLVN